MHRTYVESDLFQSPAFFSLTGVAPQVLINFLGKRLFQKCRVNKEKKWVCLNPDSLYLTYVEMKQLGVTGPRFARALDDLISKGFIEIVHHGGAFDQDKTRYTLSEKWRWWKSGASFGLRPRDCVRRGNQGKGFG